MFENQFARIPNEPPRSLDALPGLRLSAMMPSSTLFVPPIILVLFILIASGVLRHDPAVRLSYSEGKTVSGKVLSVADGSGCKNLPSRRVTYAFSPEPDSEFRGVATLCQGSPYFDLKGGDAVAVKFVLADPSINVMSGANAEGFPFALFLILPAFFLLMFTLPLIGRLRELLRVRRLFVKGHLAVGNVVFIKRRADSSTRDVRYACTNEVFIEFGAAGAKREAVAQCQNEWLLNQLSPGTEVHIAYSPKDPARVALLEAYLR